MLPVDVATTVSGLVAILSGVIAVLAWRNRPKPGATTLSVLMAAVATWNATEVSFLFVSTYLGARLTYSFVFVAAAATATAFFAFALEYTGREQFLRRPYVYALAAEPTLVAVLTATQEFHGLFWSDIVPDTAATLGYTFYGGAGTDAHLVYAYALVSLGTLLIVRRIYASRGVHRRQALAILIGVLAPWFGNAMLLLDLTELGQAGGFAVTGVVVYWAITEYQLVDLTPVARATVVDELEVGVVVIDGDDRVTDLNRFSRELLGIDRNRDVIGEPARDLLAAFPGLCDHLAEEGGFETTITVESGPRTLTAQASVLSDSLDRDIGRLLLFEDVTEQQRRQEALQTRNEQLQQFASMVSHDLRNPLDVADGYVSLMQASRAETDDGVVLETDRLAETAAALDRIEAIVDDVLTLAREGEAATDPETVSLRATAETAWDHVDTRGSTLAVDGDASVVADRGQLTRVFENLFRNAVEHGTSPRSQAHEDAVEHDSTGRGTDSGQDGVVSDGDGVVTVSVGPIRDGRGLAGFYVADDGPGIPPEEREAVFETGVSSAADGTGFGLSIVERLARAHGWSVAVTDAEDGGARFEFTGITETADVDD